ncbi:hypothetical protein Tco_0448064 [Tanacetum coccineum]
MEGGVDHGVENHRSVRVQGLGWGGVGVGVRAGDGGWGGGESRAGRREGREGIVGEVVEGGVAEWGWRWGDGTEWGAWGGVGVGGVGRGLGDGGCVGVGRWEVVGVVGGEWGCTGGRAVGLVVVEGGECLKGWETVRLGGEVSGRGWKVGGGVGEEVRRRGGRDGGVVGRGEEGVKVGVGCRRLGEWGGVAAELWGGEGSGDGVGGGGVCEGLGCGEGVAVKEGAGWVEGWGARNVGGGGEGVGGGKGGSTRWDGVGCGGVGRAGRGEWMRGGGEGWERRGGEWGLARGKGGRGGGVGVRSHRVEVSGCVRAGMGVVLVGWWRVDGGGRTGWMAEVESDVRWQGVPDGLVCEAVEARGRGTEGGGGIERMVERDREATRMIDESCGV